MNSTANPDSASSGISANIANVMTTATGDTERHAPGSSFGKTTLPLRLRLKIITQPDTIENSTP